eukprot:COSAG06_NODE_4627_length_4088_cov_146.121835_3_plen_120_part_00
MRRHPVCSPACLCSRLLTRCTPCCVSLLCLLYSHWAGCCDDDAHTHIYLTAYMIHNDPKAILLYISGLLSGTASSQGAVQMAMMVDILPGDLREQVREREEKQQQQQQQQSSLCVINRP